MTEEEKEKIKQVNLDKAKNNFKWIILQIAYVMIIECLNIYQKTVVVPTYITIISRVFAIITFIALILGRIFIERKDELKAKLFIMYAIIPLTITLICDFIYGINDMNQNYEYEILNGRINENTDIGYYCFINIIVEIMCITSITKVIRNLSKANDPIANKESTDWFYERYNDK